MRTARFLSVILLVCTCATWSTPAIFATSNQQSSRTSGNTLSEEFSFEIKNFKVDHQGESVLNIEVKFRYRANMQTADYPDFRPMVKEVENFINNYPNETDYWEIVNKKLTQMFMDKYPALIAINSRIQISPQPDVPYFRASTASRTRK